MGKRHAADSENHQHETPQKRQKVAIESPTNYSPALNVSFTLTKELVDGTILNDLTLKDWRIGKPIGKGSFGEIFLASDDVCKPVTSENAKYVVKIEPHSNGPLFVEIHALINTAKRLESNPIPPGMPEYIASGSHYFKNERYRFLILKRYQRDLHSLIKNKRVDPKSIPVVALQILDVLEHLHDKGYVHSDIKAENLMIGKVPVSELVNVKSANVISNSFANSDKSPNKKKTAAAAGGYDGLLSTPTVSVKKSVEFSGSNPIRSCRGSYAAESETYQNMVKSHYLRPLKNIVYRDDSDDEDSKNSKKKRKRKQDGDTSKSFFYHITTKNVGENFKHIDVQVSRNGAALKIEAKAAVEDKKKRKQGSVGSMEERIHLIDFGLASKFIDSTGQHRPFCMDQRRAHDGTLEFTSRDAHMGAHARRSDLECLGYNLIFWSRGFLPWKDEKMLNQPEQVHRMKEYFMTDVREMLRTIYGEDCPKYLGEFLHYVGGLTYDERPDYDYLRSLFFQELQRLGHKPKSRLKLIVEDVVKLSQPLTAQDEAEITNKINHVKSLMKLGVLPYRESTLHNKTTSPKNLRSKRDSNRTPAANGKPNGVKNDITAKKEKKFCWSEILSTDPDQIARERAEKEFERADQMEEVVIRYSGNPTYAIRELENKKEHAMDYMESEDYIKGYTKPMMDILRKRQSQLNNEDVNNSKRLSNGAKKPPDDKEEEVEQQEDDDEDVEENSSANEEEDDDEEEVTVEEEDDEEEEEEEEEEEKEDSEEADSGNDDVDSEEEEEAEEELIHDRRKITQGRKQISRKLGRTTKAAAIRKEETDSDFINDAEEEEEEDEEEEQKPDDDEDGAASDDSEVIGKPRKGRRRQLPSESSDQKDSDFNDQESSEYESRDSRGRRKARGRPRLNRERSKPGPNQQPYSKANAGNNTKVPVIARNNNNNNNHHKPYYGDVDDSSHDAPMQHDHHQQQQKYRLMKRRKSGLRERIRPTARSITYQDDLQQKRSRKTSQKRYSDDEDYSQVDESSCSSRHSATLVVFANTAANAGSDCSEYLHSAAPKRKSSRKRVIRTFSNSSRSALSSNSRSSSVHNVVANGGVAATNGHGIYSGRRIYPDDEDDFFDDDDTRDMDYSPVKSKRTRKSTSSRKSVLSMKKKHGESRGAAGGGSSTATSATTTVVTAVAKSGVVAGLRGRRDHAIRSYSRG